MPSPVLQAGIVPDLGWPVSALVAVAEAWAAGIAWLPPAQTQAGKPGAGVVAIRGRSVDFCIRSKVFASQLFLWHRIVTAPGQGIASQHAPHSQCGAVEETVEGHRFGCVFRTRRAVTAGRSEHR